MAIAGLAALGRGASWIIGQTGRMRLRIDFHGPDLERMFARFGASIEDFSRFWIHEIAPMFFDDVQENIRTQGGLVGGWRALSPRYAAWKRSKVGHDRIMVLSGALRDSLRVGGPGNIVQASRRQVLLGSRVHYLPYHQTGTSRMPRRTVLVWMGDRRYGRKLADFVKTNAMEAGFPNVRLRRGGEGVGVRGGRGRR